MQGPVSVPQRISTVVVGPMGQPTYNRVHGPIAAIDIRKQRWGERGVIERRVKYPPLRIGTALDRDSPKLLLPGRTRRRADPVEVPLRNLCLQVAQRAVGINRGDPDLHE